MDPARRELAERLLEASRAHDEAQASRLARFRNVELDAERSAMAQRHLADAGLAAELRVEDAGRTLADSRDQEWDLIFLDAERPAYAGYWPDLVRALSTGGLLVIDNVLSHADQVREISDLITRDARVASAVVPIGAGVRIVVKGR